MAKIYYQWRVLGTVDKPGLLFMFDTPELALKGLDDFGARKDAETEKWVLVKITQEPLEDQPFNP